MVAVRNTVEVVGSEAINRYTIPINGFRKGDISEYHNLQQNLAKFKQVEVLSGSVSLYMRPGIKMSHDPEEATVLIGGVLGHQTIRNWVDQNLEIQEELIVPKTSTRAEMWTYSSEIPGYGVKFLPTIYTKDIKKFKFKASKKDWKILNANPTGFQQNLPLESTDPPETLYPKNLKRVIIDIADWDSTQGVSYQLFFSQKILIRLKGRVDL